MTDDAPIRIERGRIICYRVFDVADAIALDRAESRLAAAAGPRRRALQREGAQSLLFATAPLDTSLGEHEIELQRTGTKVKAATSARLFDYGAVSIRFSIALEPSADLETLLPLCDELYDSAELDAVGLGLLRSLVEKLGDAIGGGHPWDENETFTVVFAEKITGATCTQLRSDSRIARLLVGEASTRKLSEGETRDVLQHAHSYFEDDLVIVDWNSALVVEPGGSTDIPELLEFATAQLLELRYYDRILDRELGRIYDRFMRAKSRWAVFRSPYGRLAREVLRRLVELTEFTERVDNALKVVGDFYLARVYDAALKRFRIPAWRTSIDDKQALVARAYDMLKGEVEIQRSQLLEIIVILLIAIELVTAWRTH